MTEKDKTANAAGAGWDSGPLAKQWKKRDRLLKAIEETYELQDRLPGEIEQAREAVDPSDRGTIDTIRTKETMLEVCAPCLKRHQRDLAEVEIAINQLAEEIRPDIETEILREIAALNKVAAKVIMPFCGNRPELAESVANGLPAVQEFTCRMRTVVCQGLGVESAQRLCAALVTLAERGTLLPVELADLAAKS